MGICPSPDRCRQDGWGFRLNENPVRAYFAVTLAYWSFMLTDGALRMLVLLHFHTLGFSPIQLAYLFLLYEIAGIITNLGAGWLAARFGLTRTLYLGLSVQIAALVALTFLEPAWSIAASVAFVMMVQGAAGVAKDLTKMSSKSAVKLLVPKSGGGLFKWVALLTGSKNAVKGLGFFLGAGALGVFGFIPTLWGMAGFLVAVLLAILVFMPSGLPAGRQGVKFSQVFSRQPAINWLSAARVFLFGARDVWFVVGLPIYFTSLLSDGSAAGNREAFFLTGGFMAIWIILYGAVQASAPKFLGATHDLPAMRRLAVRWAGWLFIIMLGLVGASLSGSGWHFTTLLILGLLVFGAVFAVNSSLHSYLVLALSKSKDVTMDVGFYYMANAAGRLLGTLLSGLSYQVGGLTLTLSVAAVMVALSWLFAKRLSQLEIA